MSRAPPGIAATDFKGSGAPLEKGRTESWNVPRDVLPAQPSGTAAAAGTAASNTVVRMRITFLRRPRSTKVDNARDCPALHIRAGVSIRGDFWARTAYRNSIYSRS